MINGFPGEHSSCQPWELTSKKLSENYGWEMKLSGELIPWKGDLPPVGTWRMDPATKGLEQLRYMPLNQLEINEPEADVINRQDYNLYIQWAKEGLQPPPINVIKHIKGHWLSLNRRRVMAARKAGQKFILAWVSDTSPTGRAWPTHEDVIKKAIAEGKQVPGKVLDEYNFRRRKFSEQSYNYHEKHEHDTRRLPPCLPNRICNKNSKDFETTQPGF